VSRWLLVLAVVVAGCGGGGEGFTREDVEASMSDAMREQLPAGTTMEDLECVEDEDRKYRCLTTAERDGQRYRVTVEVTCDESDRCIVEPGSYVRVP
jgi:hypothetical protein